MTATAHFIAIVCYIGAAALAATPFARRVGAPLRGVLSLLAVGVVAHVAALAAVARGAAAMPFTGLGPALSFASLSVALTLLIVETLARDVSLTLVASPLAAIAAAAGAAVGLHPILEPQGVRGVWIAAHIALSFIGIAAFATAAAAGTIYLVERRELKSRRFGAIFRFFPPLETLDRVNHVAAVGGWLGLTLGVALAGTYSLAYEGAAAPKLIWSLAAWAAATALAFGRMLGGWRARRAAIVASVSFAFVVALYVAVRFAAAADRGRFL